MNKNVVEEKESCWNCLHFDVCWLVRELKKINDFAHTSETTWIQVRDICRKYSANF